MAGRWGVLDARAGIINLTKLFKHEPVDESGANTGGRSWVRVDGMQHRHVLTNSWSSGGGGGSHAR